MFNNIKGFSYTLIVEPYTFERSGGYFKGSLNLLSTTFQRDEGDQAY